jgi:hypothetical protein
LFYGAPFVLWGPEKEEKDEFYIFSHTLTEGENFVKPAQEIKKAL